ncbi:MAG: hypothetical protein AB1704_26065 [Pseudomonadota bacterium]|jgi:hypothetical protein|uniref:hypothetical protein n=1 Tax=Burkholderiaceae TaxID=119060 RepID=UPI0010F637CD|nr:hypothetical protein [Burkholderia sp. 4M9327F10]
MNEHVHKMRRDSRNRSPGLVVAEPKSFASQDRHNAVQAVVHLAKQDPMHAFTTAMHIVASQIPDETSDIAPLALSLPLDHSRLVGILHRQTARRMHCFPSATAVRDGGAWVVSADALLGVDPSSVRRWCVLAHTDGDNIDAFWIDPAAEGVRQHPEPAAGRLAPFNAYTFTLDKVRVAESGRVRLGRADAPGPILLRLARVYPAMASALCCGIGHATRTVASRDVGTSVRASTYPIARCRTTERLSRVDALLLTSEVLLRDIASDLVKGGASTTARRSVRHLHRLAMDSSIAAISLASRSLPKLSNLDHASLHRYRRDAAATCALAASFDTVHALSA